MAVTPEIKSYDQYLEEALQGFLSKWGGTDLNVGSAILSFFEANTQLVYRATGAVLQTINDNSVDRATGDQLKKIAIAARVPLKGAVEAKSVVTIRDTSFEKITAKVYAGRPAPNIGSTIIPVGDATLFPASGNIYIGRGTPNVEGPIPYTAVTPVGSYYEITLAQPTLRFHNISETVTLAQGGNRPVYSNSVVQTVAIGGVDPVKYFTTESVTLLDGENEIQNVAIIAQVPGVSGNQPRNAVRLFLSEPFPGATVTNPNSIVTGRDDEDDESLRTRIKQSEASKGLGSPSAIENAVGGAQAPDESATVTSSQLIRTATMTTLYVDDGTGYERKTDGVGLEYIVDSAIGGEKDFQLSMSGRQTSVAKAFLLSNQSQPYAVNGGDRLSILVGGTLSEHQFDTTDFQSNGAASAYEVVASINANPNLLFQAATSGSGSFVVLQAKAETNDYIQLSTPSSGVDSAPSFNFPAREIETLRLYKNDQPLSGTGRAAFVNTTTQTSWSSSITQSDTLIIAVDGTAAITYTFPDQVFADNTIYPITSSTNSLEAWVTVINKVVTGITASVDGLTIRITSNRGLNSTASIVIDPTSTLVTKGVFVADALSAVGIEKDYQLDRNTGQLELTVPLAAGDRLTAGTANTFASIISDDLLGATVTLAGDANVWILVDDFDAERVVTQMQPGLTIGVTNPTTNTIRYTAPTAVFARLAIGDYFINTSTAFAAGNRIEGRVKAKDGGNTWFELELTSAETITPESVIYDGGWSFTRSTQAPQRLKILTGTYNINDLAIQLNEVTIGASFSVEDDLRLVLRSNTLLDDGAIMIQHTDFNAEPLGLQDGVNNKSYTSLAAFVETDENQIFTPYFIHTDMATEESANPPDSYISSIDTTIALGTYLPDENALFAALNPYGQSDAQGINEFTQIKNISTNTVDLTDSEFIKRLRLKDRAFAARPFEFGPSSTLIAILDNNPSEKTFFIPFYRNITTNTTHVNNASAFNAYDSDFGPTGDLAQTFGNEYLFDNYKAFMKAKIVIDQTGDENAILFRSILWGKSGEFVRIAYVYPQSADQPIDHIATVGSTTDIQIVLPSGTGINSLMDGTTEWNVTVTPNIPAAGSDMVTVTYSGTGAAPALTLSGGEFVNIRNSGEFQTSMVGAHRVSDEAGFTPTANSFSFPVLSGTVTPESNVANLVINTITFYNADAPTAQEIVDYVNNNLQAYLVAANSDDNGTSGSGLIVYSTAEESLFADPYHSLQDGENFIEVTDLDGASQFSFKRPLTYITGQGYQFNDGEQIRLVPTTPVQVVEFLNTLAVTGLSTLATITTGQKGRTVQISSNMIGSDGAVQIAGGGASVTSLDVINTALSQNGYVKVPVSTAQANSLSAGQFVKISTENPQEKQTGITTTNTVLATPNVPLSSQSIITIGNKTPDQMLFGYPRIDINDEVTWKVEKQGPFVCISWDGNGSTPNFIRQEDCNFNPADTFMAVPVSSSIFELIATGSTDFQKVEMNDYLTLDFDQFVGTFKIVGKGATTKSVRLLSNEPFTGSSVSADITITNNANLTGDSFTAGTATLTAGVEWVIGGSAAITATNLAAAISAVPGFTASALSNVVTVTTTASSPGPILTYNNVGASGATVTSFSGGVATTLYSINGLNEGDTVTIGGPVSGGFDSLNRGKFRIIRVFDNSFYIDNPNVVEEEVTVVNQAVTATVPGVNSFTAAASPFAGERTRLTSGTSNFANVYVGDIVTFNSVVTTVVGVGTNYFEVTTYEIPFGVYANATVTFKRPDMLFFQYDAAAAADNFVFTGNYFLTNQGKHPVVRTLSPNQLVVESILAPIDAGAPTTPVILNANADNLYLEEGEPYVGYKEVAFITAEPANADISYLMLEPDNLAEKINQAYISTVTPTSRLNYPINTVVGLDAYRHDVGMLAEVNRITYGDPRDKTTYPGVAAAGADIFIDPPLVRRVKVGVSIRLNTGIPLAAIVEQVRNTVQAIVDSNPIGESIAISSIVGAIDEIPGVRAMAVTSPLYDANNDLIVVQPGEKSRILNPVADISVSAVS